MCSTTALLTWSGRTGTRAAIGWPTSRSEKSLQSVEHEEVDLQLPAYQYMLDRLGIPTTGSMKIQIRAELPKEPQTTQKGGMSRQRIATTWEVYSKALVQHGFNPKDYELEMKQKLDCEFFRLDQLYRNQFKLRPSGPTSSNRSVRH